MGKTPAVCEPHLQTSAAEGVDQTSACLQEEYCLFFNFCKLLK
ncbi:hypothetical protein Hanom_Chr02g00154051 [Helianthus anomalus]